MKKTTLVSGLLLSTLINAQTLTTNPGTQGQTGEADFTRGTSVLVSDPSTTSTVEAGSVHCGSDGVHADNSYFRSFDIDGLGQIEITDIDIGIESATGGNGSGEQPVNIRIHSIANGGTLPSAALTLVTELTATVSDSTLSVINIPISAELDAATNDLVVEINTPDGDADGHGFFFGSNPSAQNRDFFLSAEACDITEPTSTAGIGFPDMRGIIVVNGLANVPVELMNFSIE